MLPKNKLVKALLLCFNKSPEAATEYLKSLGIEVTWDWKDAIAAIKKRAFTVSKVSNADVLQTIKNELVKAMNDGRTYDQFKKDLEPILKEKGYARKEDGSAWRLETIYRMNMQSSYMAGRYHEMKAVEDEFPFWELVVILDSRTSPICGPLANTILPSNNSFWSTHYPPLHFGCRSRVVSRSQAMLDRDGLKIAKLDSYKNIKPAEGFDNSPGDWQPDLSHYDKDLQKQLKKVI